MDQTQLHTTEALVKQYFHSDFFELFFLGIAGALVHAAIKLQKGGKKSTIYFNFGISTLIVAILVYIRDEMVTVFPLTKLIVVGVGYSAQSIFENIVSLARKKAPNASTDSPADPDDRLSNP